MLVHSERYERSVEAAKHSTAQPRVFLSCCLFKLSHNHAEVFCNAKLGVRPTAGSGCLTRKLPSTNPNLRGFLHVASITFVAALPSAWHLNARPTSSQQAGFIPTAIISTADASKHRRRRHKEKATHVRDRVLDVSWVADTREMVAWHSGLHACRLRHQMRHVTHWQLR